MDNAQTREYKNEWDRAHKEDIKIRKRIRGALIKKTLVEYKGGACSVCGYNKNIAVLSFHHINDENNQKEYDISIRMGNRCSLETLKKEADKCILVCENCHREIHQKELDEKYREIEEKYIAGLSDASRASLFKI
ncbi:MAG TPA: hypothetical protein PK685_03850 [archaeon]|nr:hypothetical protein [archaeon]